MTHGALGMLDDMLFWRFKMAQIWNRRSDNLFSRFLRMELHRPPTNKKNSQRLN